MLSLLLAPAVWGVLTQAASDSNPKYKLSIEAKAPDSALNVPADFFSFGFETGFFDKFNNPFSENIVESVGKRMGAPIILRIGGTSGDLVSYKESQDEATVCVDGPSCPHSSKDTFSLGPSYFKAFGAFKDAHMVIQAPIYPKQNKTDWLNRTMDYVTQATKELGQDRLAAIALGNEPNWYDYDQDTYISRALQVEKAVIKKLGLKGDDQRIFELGEIPNAMLNKAKRSYTYSLVDLLKNKMNENGNGKFAAQHFYQVGAGQDASNSDIQKLLMSHKAITGRFGPLDEAVKYINDNDKKLSYVISETGSAIGGEDVQFAGSFAAALWAVDFHLYAMTRGVQRISNTMRPEATHAFWIPDDSAPGKKASVQGLFPAAPFIADFVGKDSATQVAEISVDGKPDHFTAYAAYNKNSGAIKRVALVNLVEWSPNSQNNRGNTTVTLDVGSAKPSTVQRLHAENGAGALGYDYNHNPHDNITWAGEQWSVSLDSGKGHFSHGKEHESVKMVGGKATVYVPDSEAVIVSFK